MALWLTLVVALCVPVQAQTQLKPPPSDRSLLPPTASTSETTANTTTTETPPPDNNKLSFLKLLTRGGWAMWPLAVCSLIGLALVIERALALRRREIIPAGFMDELKRIYHGRSDTRRALDYCNQRPSAVARIMAAAIRKMPDGPAVTEQAIADQGATEIARLRRNLRMLHGIAAITPTLGLLGTVTGMIRAFEVASSVGLGKPETLMLGIYEALVATMTGLMIAVPVLFFYYLFLGVIDRTILELNDQAQSFLEPFDRDPASLERERLTEPLTPTSNT